MPLHVAAEAPIDEGCGEDICRICFDGPEEGELVSPCSCTGGQRYVHMDCLRRWQRMALVNQPTHPAFYDRNQLHQKCGICQVSFTVAPPSRHELMQSFTGAELAAMISPGCILATDEAVSRQLEQQQAEMLRPRAGRPAGARAQAASEMLDHWVRSVHLITTVQEEDGLVRLVLPTRAAREAFARELAGGPSVSVRGRSLRVLRWEEGAVVLAPEEGVQSECGEDLIVAVNLARVLDRPPDARHTREAIARANKKAKGADRVAVSHYLGGPCSEESVACCIVPGGARTGNGWTVVPTLEEAVLLAHSRADGASSSSSSASPICGGQTVRLVGATPEDGLELGLALEYHEPESPRSAGKWLVQLCSGEGVRVPASDLEPVEGGTGRVLCFWGDARWSRVQLLGEIARGHWGLCRAGVLDLILPPTERWPGLDGRLAFAPCTEMTEGSLEEARRQMTAYRATGLTQQAPDAD